MSHISNYGTKIQKNKVRCSLLLMTSYELGLDNSQTMINSLSRREFEEKMNENLFIEIKQDFTSPKNELINCIVQKIEYLNITDINQTPIVDNIEDQEKIQGNIEDYNNFSKFQRTSLSVRKMKNFRLNSLDKLSMQEELRKILEKKNLHFFEKTEKKTMGKLGSIFEDKFQKIIDYLNFEKAYFINPQTQIRSKAGFFYLRNLSCSLKHESKKTKNEKLKPRIIRSKKDLKDYSEVENIMFFKENLDESNISRRKSIDNISMIIELKGKNNDEERPIRNVSFSSRMIEEVSVSTFDEYDLNSPKAIFPKCSKNQDSLNKCNNWASRKSLNVLQSDSLIKLYNCDKTAQNEGERTKNTKKSTSSRINVKVSKSGKFEAFEIPLFQLRAYE